MTESMNPSELPPHSALTLARMNLWLANDWSHVTPSEKQARIEECHDMINDALDRIQEAR